MRVRFTSLASISLTPPLNLTHIWIKILLFPHQTKFEPALNQLSLYHQLLVHLLEAGKVSSWLPLHSITKPHSYPGYPFSTSPPTVKKKCVKVYSLLCQFPVHALREWSLPTQLLLAVLHCTRPSKPHFHLYYSTSITILLLLVLLRAGFEQVCLQRH